MESKKKKVWPWILAVAVIAIIAVVVILLNGTKKEVSQTSYDEYTVAPGSISKTITGSGMLENADAVNIDVPEGIEVSKVLVKAGENVSSGQVLASFDVDSVRQKVATLSEKLNSLDQELARMNRNMTVMYVYATAKGRIKYIPVSVGDDVLSAISKYGVLAFISTDGLMQVKITTSEELTLHSDVTVKWSSGSDKGKIAEKTSDGYLITLDDDKAPYNETAQVYSGKILLGEGKLEIHMPSAVYSNGGTISKIRYKVNDKVTVSSKLFTLENEPLSDSYQQKYAERNNVAGQLDQVLSYMNNPNIVAPSDGLISKVNVSDEIETGSTAQAGSSADNSTASTNKSTAFVLNTGGATKMVISVDELDINSVALNQKATITLDAFSSEKFTAEVTHISNLGNAEGSITTYKIELTLSSDKRFFEGMNGNATILVDQANDVLLVPIEAINEDSSGAFVYVGSSREKTYIKTGLSDGEYAEVTDGLSEGDIVQYIKSIPSKTENAGIPSNLVPASTGGDGK